MEKDHELKAFLWSLFLKKMYVACFLGVFFFFFCFWSYSWCLYSSMLLFDRLVCGCVLFCLCLAAKYGAWITVVSAIKKQRP